MRAVIRSSLAAAVLTVGFTAAMAVPALGQDRPNLSGTWVLAADRSDFGPMPAPASRTDVIEHSEPNLKVNRTQAAQGDEITATMTYVIDGKPHVNTPGGQEVSSVLAWDGAVLVITSTVQTPQGEASLVDRYALSADGKELTQDRTIQIAGQVLAQTMVLVRQ